MDRKVFVCGRRCGHRGHRGSCRVVRWRERNVQADDMI